MGTTSSQTINASMTLIEAIILGIIQGLTEFIPVSSSAHLTLAGLYMGRISSEHPEQWTVFIAVMQLGTLIAVITYYYRDILNIIAAFFRENIQTRIAFSAQSFDSRLGWYIVIGTLPIATLGLVLKKIIEGQISKSPVVIATGLIILALLMALAEKKAAHARTLEQVTWRDALIIGCAQVFALFPGPSRSGTTITAGLFTGLRRDVAARFSFLLSIPAIGASGLLELKDAVTFMATQDILLLLVATIVSGISGYAAIAFLLRYLRTHSTMIFVYYRIILGIIILSVVFR